MYILTLKDGTVTEFSGINGDNLIVPDKKEMDTSVFTDANLKSCIFTAEDGSEYPYEDLEFIQQQKQRGGDYYVCFCQKTPQQVAMAEMRELLIDIAEIEVDSGDLELEDIPESFQEAVKVKIDDSKRLDK